MKKTVVLCSVLLVVVVACTNTQRVPSDIYPKEKMEAILWDMLLADRYSAQYLLKDSLKINVRDTTFKLYDQVFQVHRTTKEEFLKSYKFYLSRPDITKVMLDSLAARSNRSREALLKDLH